MTIRYSEFTNMERVLAIKIEQCEGEFCAEVTAMAGIPFIGVGATVEAAKYDLMLCLLYSVVMGQNFGYADVIANLIKEDLLNG